MRKKNKYLLGGMFVGALSAAAVDVIIQWIQCLYKGKPFNWENYNGKRTLTVAAVGAAVGSGIGLVSYHQVCEKERQNGFDPNDYLNQVLRDESIANDPSLLQKVLKRRAEMKEWLSEKFGAKLVAQPIDNGSFHKRTANKSNFDLDITLVFAKNCGMTLEKIFEIAYQGLNKKFGSVAVITRKTRVINVEFGEGTEKIKFDIVPSRERGSFDKDKEVTLYVQPEWFWQKGSSFKTNISMQRTATRNKPEARRAIRLIKAYRDRNGFDIPTVLIEHCCIDALSHKKSGITWSDHDNFIDAMWLLANKLEQKSVIDPANSNNNLAAKVSEDDRLTVADQIRSDVQSIERDPFFLKEIFELD